MPFQKNFFERMNGGILEGNHICMEGICKEIIFSGNKERSRKELLKFLTNHAIFNASCHSANPTQDPCRMSLRLAKYQQITDKTSYYCAK